MKIRKRQILRICLLSLVGLLGSCSSDHNNREKEVKLSNFKEHVTYYNDKNKTYVEKRLNKAKTLLADLNKKITESNTEKKASLEKEVAIAQRDVSKWQQRQSLGDYFAFKTIEDIPENLIWETGMDEEEIGDPAAKKGGALRIAINYFPPTLRPIGPESNHMFRDKMYLDTEIGLIGIHPDTYKPLPGIAHTWAVSEDRRTIYYKINPKATYSDGVPIKANDFLFGVYLRTSDNIFAPFSKQYFRDQFAQFAIYDDYTLSVTLPEEKPNPYLYASVSCSAPHFYKEFGPDYKERYQWRVPPSTGAYQVHPEGIVKGRSITMERVKDWWAKDMKYYRYRFNPDKLHYKVIASNDKAYELFKLGQIDFIDLENVKNLAYWYEKSEIEPVYKGYIHKTKFYRNWPTIPFGMYMNMDEGLLKERDIRVGIQHSLNFQRVNDSVYRGDYTRINTYGDGYGRFTNTSIKAREYSPKTAREYFAKAGFTKEGKDGILMREDGTRLSISCSIRNDPSREEQLAILASETKKCGFELRIDSQALGVWGAKINKKEHEITFLGWGVGPPYPQFRQGFHSDQAFDEKGERKMLTNNLCSFADPRMDVVSENIRYARTEEEIEVAAHEAAQIVHDSAAYAPGVAKPFTVVIYWRWMCWPDTEEMQFCYGRVFELGDSHVFWIDEEKQKETLAARKAGQSFPETEQVYDQFRVNVKGKKDE